MILTFSSTDTLYKIFKTLKKVPSYKKVTIVIDPKHELFNHEWRGDQLHELVEQNHLHALFLAPTNRHLHYFENAGLTTSLSRDQGILGWLRRARVKRGGGSGKKSSLLQRSKAPGYLIVVAEVAVLVLVGVFFRGVISPKAIITLDPNVLQKPVVYQYFFYPAEISQDQLPSDIRIRNMLTIPYYVGSFEYSYELTSDIERIIYTYQPAEGSVTLYNSSAVEIPLREGTRLQSSTDIIYTIDTATTIPPGTPEEPGTVDVTITASQDLRSPSGVGERSNIEVGSRLVVVAFTEEQRRSVWAEVSESVTGGTTTATGIVQESDVSIVEEKIRNRMEESVRQELRTATLPEERVVVQHPDMVGFRFEQFASSAIPGDEITFIDGKGTGTIRYRYFLKDDLYSAVGEYLTQRPSEDEKLIEINEASLTAYGSTLYTLSPNQQGTESTTGSTFSPGPLTFFYTPIKIDTIRTYDLEEDVKRITEEMREKVAGLPKEDARKLLIEYPQVRDATVRIKPSRYTTLPNEFQRIQVQ